MAGLPLGDGIELQGRQVEEQGEIVGRKLC